MEWVIYVYFASAIVGLIWALMSLFLGGDHGLGGNHIGDVGDTGYLEGGPGEISFVPFSPTVIAAFLTSFGVLGIIGHIVFDLDPWLSAVTSLVGGVIVGLVLAFLLGKLFSITTSTSHPSQQELIGHSAEVITPIPSDGIGEIAYVLRGSRFTVSARSAENNPVPRGATVIVDRIVGSTAFVKSEGVEASTKGS